jgi:hypothetical protein
MFGLLVVAGVHCVLSNISSEGRWIQSESFMYKGKLVRRVQGESVGRLMLPWRRIRVSLLRLCVCVCVCMCICVRV